jgi:hypothetical protein
MVMDDGGGSPVSICRECIRRARLSRCGLCTAPLTNKRRHNYLVFGPDELENQDVESFPVCEVCREDMIHGPEVPL